MTQQATAKSAEAMVPEWDLADRLAKSLRASGVQHQEMAAHLGVTPTTIGRWTNGHTEPSVSQLGGWAGLTGIDMEWIVTGRARRDSNPQPSDLCTLVRASLTAKARAAQAWGMAS